MPAGAAHYREKYAGTFPIWVAVKMMSCGSLSKMYAHLQHVHRNKIAQTYCGLDEKFLRSKLKSLVIMRNDCAHFSRLYGRRPVFSLQICCNNPVNQSRHQSLFAILMAARRLYKPWSKWENFITQMEALCAHYANSVIVEKPGFPDNWPHLLRTAKN